MHVGILELLGTEVSIMMPDGVDFSGLSFPLLSFLHDRELAAVPAVAAMLPPQAGKPPMELSSSFSSSASVLASLSAKREQDN